MFPADITARLRGVLDEVCVDLPKFEIGTRALVASKLLENAARGDVSVDGLMAAGHRALAGARADAVSA